MSAPQMASTTCARLLPRLRPPLPLLARLPARSPTTTTSLQFHHNLLLQQLRHASKKATKKKKLPPPLPVAAAPPAPPPPLPRFIPLPELLGNSGKPQILYEYSSRLFVVGCYGLAAGMVAWSVYTWDTNIAKHRPGVPRWVLSATYVSITVMMVLAAGVVYYPTRIIQIIHAHPIPATARMPASVSITLLRRPVLPLLPLRRIHVASPDLITLGESLQLLHPPTPAAAAGSGVVDKRSAVAKVRNAVTSVPFRVFDFCRRAFSTGGFVTLRVEDVGRFKISKDGRVWQRRGLERLFKVQRG